MIALVLSVFISHPINKLSIYFCYVSLLTMELPIPGLRASAKAHYTSWKDK